MPMLATTTIIQISHETIVASQCNSAIMMMENTKLSAHMSTIVGHALYRSLNTCCVASQELISAYIFFTCCSGALTPVGMQRCSTGADWYTGNGGQGPLKSKYFAPFASCVCSILMLKSYRHSFVLRSS
uniref:Uncharacterized protein n=1 Tax=Anopheles christyi TaxID=43041 RepID=A0A182KIG9_9DIPT